MNVEAEALRRTAREAVAQHYASQMAFGRAVDLLYEIREILDEPLDEREGQGLTRTGQFARIDALLKGWPAPLARDGFSWGDAYRHAEGWIASRAEADRRAIRDETNETERSS